MDKHFHGVQGHIKEYKGKKSGIQIWIYKKITKNKWTEDKNGDT